MRDLQLTKSMRRADRSDKKLVSTNFSFYYKYTNENKDSYIIDTLIDVSAEKDSRAGRRSQEKQRNNIRCKDIFE